MVRIELKNDEISSNSSWKQGSQFLFSTHLPVKIELIKFLDFQRMLEAFYLSINIMVLLYTNF